MADVVGIDPRKNVIPPVVAGAIRNGQGVDAGALMPPPLPTGDAAVAAANAPTANALTDAPTPPPSVLDMLTSTQPPETLNTKVPSPVDSLTASMQPRIDQQRPQLAPPPKKSLGQKIMGALPYVGAVGAALEASSTPAGRTPQGAEMLAQSIAGQRAAALKEREMEEVEKPKAQAQAAYFEALNPTRERIAQIGAEGKENVQGLKNTGGLAIQGLKNTGAMDVATLRAQVALGKVTMVRPGYDENGEIGMNAYNAQGQLVGRVQGALPPASYLPKSTTTDQFMLDADGNIQRLQRGSTSGPVLPPPQPGGGVGAPVSAPAPSAPASTAPRPRPATPVKSSSVVTDSSGQPIRSIPGAKLNMKWVQGTDASGRTVAMPYSEATKAGLDPNSIAELPAQEIRDVQNARHTVTLLTKRGDPAHPETNGVLQLIDSLDADGKLGILASRWNRFMTSGVGASPDDDPRIITLINKNMLTQTGTMLAHFGASGGRSPQMLQHFLDLANSGKMDGVTLRAGAKAMADYMTDRAMLPGSAAPKPPSGPSGHIINYNGKRYQYKGSGDTADIRNYAPLP